MIYSTYRFIAAAILSSMLTACAQNVSSTTYTAGEVGVAAKVVPGTIVSRRTVTINANSGTGGIAGTVAGAAGGSGLGSNTRENIVGAVGGAVVGGLVGNAIDKSVNTHQGLEYIIKLKSGGIISIVQEANTAFMHGQPVLIIYGAMTRLIADTTRS